MSLKILTGSGKAQHRVLLMELSSFFRSIIIPIVVILIDPAIEQINKFICRRESALEKLAGHKKKNRKIESEPPQVRPHSIFHISCDNFSRKIYRLSLREKPFANASSRHGFQESLYIYIVKYITVRKNGRVYVRT